MKGVLISPKEYEEYMELKKRNTPMRKIGKIDSRCPVCNYIVDNCVPRQNYCDRCGQALIR